MPRKKRDIRRDLRKLGFSESPGKGDHTVHRHPKLPYNISVDGRDGKDAERYDEDHVRQAKRDLGVK